MEKKFKCKDEILFKYTEHESAVWMYAVFSSYSKDNTAFIVSGGLRYNLDSYDILPYEGNEHLVGTTNSPDEEVRLEKGEWILTSDYIKGIKDGYCNGGRFIRIEGASFVIRTYMSPGECYTYAIRFKDFNPNDMEETKKHILCVRNGRIIRYKD